MEIFINFIFFLFGIIIAALFFYIFLKDEETDHTRS